MSQPMLGEIIEVFAWWPRKVYGQDSKGYVEFRRIVWLRRVRLFRAIPGWVAYERHQSKRSQPMTIYGYQVKVRWLPTSWCVGAQWTRVDAGRGYRSLWIMPLPFMALTFDKLPDGR